MWYDTHTCKEKGVTNIAYIVTILLCIAADQAVKFWTVANLELFETKPLLPGLVELCYVQNTGGGFSILTEHTWLLSLISAVVAAAIAVLLVKKVVAHPLGRIPLAMVLAGAVGNLIDRALFGYVTDMFQTLFIHFAVFNVADICVVCGAVLAAIYYLWFYEKYDRRGKTHGDADAPSAS